MAIQLTTVLRLLWQTAGRRMLPRAAPVYLLLALLYGMKMELGDLVSAAARSPTAALAIVGGWILLTAPAARVTLRVSTVVELLSLPVPRWQLGLAVATCLVALDAIWIVALVTLASPTAAAAFALALGAHAAIASGLGGDAVLALVACGAATLTGSVLLTSATGALATLSCLRGGLRRAAAGAAAGTRRIRARHDWTALTLTWIRVLWRSEGAFVWRGGGVSLVVGAVAGLAARNNHVGADATVGALTLGVGALAAAIVGAGVALRVAAAEARDAWLLESLGTSARLRHTSAMLAGATVSGANGVITGVTAALVVGAQPLLTLRLIGGACLFFACVAMVISRVSFVFIAQGRTDRFYTASVAFMIATQVCAGWLRDVPTLCAVAVAAALAALTARTNRARPRVDGAMMAVIRMERSK